MLTARGAKRDLKSQFKLDMRFDILDEDKLVGRLTCNMGATQATITVDDKAYTMAATEAEPDGPLADVLRQATEGRAKRSNQTFALKDAEGHTLALAKEVKANFIVAHAGKAFALRKASFFNPAYNFYPADSDQPLGSVGQKSLLARALHMDLPPEFDAPFRIYLLTLSLQMAAERSASLNAST